MARSSDPKPDGAPRHSIQMNAVAYARLSELAEAADLSRIQVVEWLVLGRPKRQLISDIKRAGIEKRRTGRKKQSVFNQG